MFTLCCWTTHVSMLLWTVASICLVYALVLLLRYKTRNRLPAMRACTSDGTKPVVVGFFHPYCNAGGGGERVLWVAIRAIQNKYPNVRCVVYTGDENLDAILPLARNRFNIVLPRTDSESLQFVQLSTRRLLEAFMYPYFTLLGQSLGSMIVGMEAMWKFLPDVYIDTMGYAFTLPIFRYLGGCKIGCYVHYPTISTDMLERVSSRTESHNNKSFISRSPVLSKGKLLYYKMFAYVYGLMGNRSDVTMVNSSWTQGHISSLWKCTAHVVYPPCDTQEFLKLPLNEKSSVKIIVSVSQFRPEKDQPLQVKAFAKFLSDNVKVEHCKDYKLVLVGSCRNEEDEARVDDLRALCHDLEVQDLVEFRLNVSFAELKRSASEATIGLHTMWNEHFGIGVVELMAGGTIVLAHNSGGPKLDIVREYNGQRTGYLADDVTSYACAMKQIFEMSDDERKDMQMVARESAKRFSDDNFETDFLACVQCLLEE